MPQSHFIPKLNSLLRALIIIVGVQAIMSCGADRYYKRGEQHWALGEYYDAATSFRQAYLKTPAKERARRGDIALRMGQGYAKSLQTAKAIAAYRNAERYHRLDTDGRRQLAQQLMLNGSYKEAEAMFRQVLDSLPNDPLATVGANAAAEAPAVKAEGSRYIVKRMEVFNGRRSDYSPMLWGDNADRIYFSIL